MKTIHWLLILLIKSILVKVGLKGPMGQYLCLGSSAISGIMFQVMCSFSHPGPGSEPSLDYDSEPFNSVTSALCLPESTHACLTDPLLDIPLYTCLLALDFWTVVVVRPGSNRRRGVATGEVISK